MALEQERGAGRGVTERGEDVGPAGGDLVDLDGESLGTQPALDVRGHRRLGRGGIARSHDAGNAHEVAGERDQLVGIDAGEDVGDAHGRARDDRAYCWGKDRITESSRMTRYSSSAM